MAGSLFVVHGLDRHRCRRLGITYLVVLNFAILPSLQQFNKVLAYEGGR